MMAYKRSSGLAQGRLWIITCYRNDRMEILTIAQCGEAESSLPLFSFKEEAEVFLSLFEDDQKRDWQSRETSAGELVSVLLAPSTNAKRVVLDPLPFPYSRAMLPLLSVSKERFVRGLMREKDREVAEKNLYLARG